MLGRGLLVADPDDLVHGQCQRDGHALRHGDVHTGDRTDQGRLAAARAGRYEARLVLPSDPTYDQVRLLENPRYDGQRPLAVLSVQSAQDVAAGLAFAQDHAVPVAVRSGGHSYPGWSGGGAPPALVIDCRPMNRVTTQRHHRHDRRRRRPGPGVRRPGDQGRAIAGGSCATVGIAGLTLGGGVGVLTRAMGLTCDAVTSMQVVTADGSVRTASAQEEPDLFWALRGGGGGHLGVVTSFDFETSAAPTLQTVYLQWPISAAAQVIEAWQDWAPTPTPSSGPPSRRSAASSTTTDRSCCSPARGPGPRRRFDRQLAGLLDHVPTPSTNTRASRSYRDAMLSYAGCASIPVDQCHTGPNGALDRESFGATSHVAYQPADLGGDGRPARAGPGRPVLWPPGGRDLHRRPRRQGPRRRPG